MKGLDSRESKGSRLCQGSGVSFMQDAGSGAPSRSRSMYLLGRAALCCGLLGSSGSRVALGPRPQEGLLPPLHPRPHPRPGASGLLERCLGPGRSRVLGQGSCTRKLPLAAPQSSRRPSGSLAWKRLLAPRGHALWLQHESPSGVGNARVHPEILPAGQDLTLTAVQGIVVLLHFIRGHQGHGQEGMMRTSLGA